VIESAPRVRVRTSADRARDQLADLAVLNERLAGKDPREAAQVRKRLEYLKRRRRSWELVYQHVTRADALCTLAAIEEAAARVEAALSEASRERLSVSALKRQLVGLQAEVAEAHARLHLTQARVEQNLRRISELKDEAARLGDVAADPAAASEAGRAAAAAVAAAAAAPAAPTRQEAPPAPAALRPAASEARARAPGHAAAAPRRSAAQRRRGLHSGLDAEEELKNHWFAVAFASKLGAVSRGRGESGAPPQAPEPPAALHSQRCMRGPARPSHRVCAPPPPLHLQEDKVPFELFGQAWVLFRDAAGRPACVLDECAHRACPLSLGRVVDGCLECPYHDEFLFLVFVFWGGGVPEAECAAQTLMPLLLHGCVYVVRHAHPWAGS
jgi:chlorophyllide a oxygenase